MPYIRHLYPLYTNKKQKLIYSVVRVLIEVKEKNMSEHNNLNWTDFILCLSMELVFGDGSRDEKVYRKLENTLSRMEYIQKGEF
mgnify:CR=1 FL=1|tara:strand:+ start:86 stop:337 length:252 start_codon:yes stop_codon:yes gene_type:complete